MLQAVRVQVSGLPRQALSDALVRTCAGTPLCARVTDGPAESVRILMPAVDAPAPVRIELPSVAPGTDLPVELGPQRRWTIHLIHHTHLDIGYTDPQGTVLAEHLSYLDSCLDLIRETGTWPEESRFRWCVEALWSFERWAWARPGRLPEFLRRVREGRIELTAMPYNLHTEACSTDELHELLRMSREVAARHGVTFRSAMQTDVPGAVAGLPGALEAAGVRYLSVAHNWAGRAVPHMTGGDRLPRLFRWRTPSGGSVLVWVTDTPHGLAYMEGPLLGFHRSYGLVDDLLPLYLAELAAKPYPFPGEVFGWPLPGAGARREPYPWDLLHLRVQGRFGDNAPPRRLIAETVRQWNQTWAYPRLRLSRNEDFFAEAENRFGDRIATFAGDWADWWAEGLGSGARPLALTRAAQAAVADAQTVSGMSAAWGAEGADDDTRDAQAVYQALSLFDEHTWGASNPWRHADHGRDSGEEQWHWKYSQALAAHDSAGALLDRAAARLGQQLGRDPAALASFHVINTAAWERTETVRIFLPDSVVPLQQPVTVVDARDGQPVAIDTAAQVNDKHRNAGRFLIAELNAIPPVGAARVDIYPADEPVAPHGPAKPAAAEPLPETILETEFLRVSVDLRRAAIASIIDKATGAEFVRPDALFGFNQYVYDQYGSAGGFNHQSSKTFAHDDVLSLLGDRAVACHAGVVDRRSSATSEELAIECAAPGTRMLRITFRLPRRCARLDIENRIIKDATGTKESGYFAFPFAMADPAMRAELTGGMTGTGLPVVPGSAAHMRAIRRWLTFEQDGLTVAWVTRDAPLIQLGTIALPYAPFPSTLARREPGTVYSWVHNNLWDTNFPSQQAFDMTFGYSIAIQGAQPDKARALTAAVLGMRTSAAASRPLRAVPGSPSGGPPEWSLVSVADPRVRLTGITCPTAGWLLLRLQSFADQPVQASVECGLPARSAWASDYLASRREPLEMSGTREADGNRAVAVSIAAQGTTGILIELGGDHHDNL